MDTDFDQPSAARVEVATEIQLSGFFGAFEFGFEIRIRAVAVNANATFDDFLYDIGGLAAFRTPTFQGRT